jgi:hypothetical protein
MQDPPIVSIAKTIVHSLYRHYRVSLQGVVQFPSLAIQFSQTWPGPGLRRYSRLLTHVGGPSVFAR